MLPDLRQQYKQYGELKVHLIYQVRVMLSIETL